MDKKATKKASMPVAKAETPAPMNNIADAAGMRAKASADDIKWKAEDALRDIERAEGHKRDNELMEHVKKLAKEKMNNLKKIC